MLFQFHRTPINYLLVNLGRLDPKYLILLTLGSKRMLSVVLQMYVSASSLGSLLFYFIDFFFSVLYFFLFLYCYCNIMFS